jgi:hypothetical protein
MDVVSGSIVAMYLFLFGYVSIGPDERLSVISNAVSIISAVPHRVRQTMQVATEMNGEIYYEEVEISVASGHFDHEDGN